MAGKKAVGKLIESVFRGPFVFKFQNVLF